jgi:hypothetical protein
MSNYTNDQLVKVTVETPFKAPPPFSGPPGDGGPPEVMENPPSSYSVGDIIYTRDNQISRITAISGESITIEPLSKSEIEDIYNTAREEYKNTWGL